jgi:hypothetical protein
MGPSCPKISKDQEDGVQLGDPFGGWVFWDEDPSV